MDKKIKLNSLTNVQELDLYSEYQHLLKKYYLRFKDTKNQSNSKMDIKSLILEYLNFKYENGEKWIKELISIVNQHQFFSQKTLNSIFYLDVYDLIVKPKCLNKNPKEKLYPQSNFFSYKLIYDKDSNDSSILFKLKKQENYELFDVIKRQLEYKDNPFNIIIKNFIDCLIKVVQFKIKFLEKIRQNKDFRNILQKLFEEFKDQINEFTALLTKCITLYYQINNIQEYDTYYALLISIIFNGKENSKILYQLLMRLISQIKKNQIENYKKILSNLKNSNKTNPEDFFVEDKFCLNDKTRQLYKDIFKKEYKDEKGSKGKPYESTIKSFRKIKEYQNPFDKLLLTVQLSKNISNDISKFWSLVDENDLKNKNIKLNIEADDFISIFKYLLIQGEIDDIYSEIFFIESFTSNQIKLESEWYYLSLLQVSLMQLEEKEEK